MSFIQTIGQYGVSAADSNAEKRNIVLANYISLLAALATLMLLAGRYLFATVNLSIVTTLVQGSLLFLVPVVLNRFGYINVSRIALCWLPSGYQLYAVVTAMSETTNYESSSYAGLRFIMIASSCFPFLVFGLKKKVFLITGLIGAWLPLFLFDPILNFFNLGYYQVGLHDISYSFNHVRAFISVFMIATSSYLLKRLVEQGEEKNELLVAELAEKNKIIQDESENLIRITEEKYHSLFQQASDFIMILDFKGNFIDVNESLLREFGYTREELKQMKIESLIEPEQIKATPIRYKELQRGDHVMSDRRMMRKDGSIIEVESNVKKVQEDRMLVIARDVTRMREVQKQIQLSEAKFRGAFQYSAIGMALVTFEGKYLQVNRELCSIVGYTEQELLSRTFMDITHPDDLAPGDVFLNDLRQGKIESYQLEKRYIHKNGSTVWINLNASLVKDGSGHPLYMVSQIEDITDRKSLEEEKAHASYLLNERIKELTTLYHASQLLEEEEKPFEEMLHEMVAILPPGWQYPEITAARIQINDDEFLTGNFKESEYKQQARFDTTFGTEGIIEVVYLEEKPAEDEGPFLKEERSLINMIAEMLRAYLVRKYEERALSEAQANLSATINNTEILIWSVDRDFRLITFNKPFFEHAKNMYGVIIEPGSVAYDEAQTPDGLEQRKQWEENYLRALSGEIVTLEETRWDMDFRYSLSPIIEHEKVVGVSVFADNITEQRIRDRELVEANKKIGELKLMALRSVMSPHFIFNVLNSIQFFIAKNDRVNAINYLSTFSKLIRSILTHSVNNKIKLTEEIEMLKNYVNLEMTRFENKFNFNLTISPEVDADSCEIPSLLIQPYVENAILHGLYNKKEQGTLDIRVFEDEEHVVFEIEDDGIGRVAAQKLREQNFPAHKSVGLKVTEERLKLINQSNNAAFEIEDLTNGSGPCGTRVRVRIKCQ